LPLKIHKMTFAQKVIWRIQFIYKKIRDKIVIPPYEEKREIILAYKKQFGLKIFIETGTFFGETIEQFKHDFKQLISFELSAELAERATKKFTDQQNVIIVNGDSGKLLQGYLTEISEPCLFWLDGHYSSEFFVGEEYIVTAKGDKATPIVEELRAILSHKVVGHVILIDDARCFTGKDDYPTIKELKKIIRKSGKDLFVKVKRDMIRITPRTLK